MVEICRRLDGIPLAIELAASRMASMTAAEVRDRLDDRFRLLVGSRRGQGRHHTLRHAVAWSYDLLDDAEQRLLRRCSVFAGGFDLAGACAVSGSDDEFATLDLLDALVRKSLLVADRSSGRTRFSMLETIRQFADDQLVQTGEADEVRAAHARYFAGRRRPTSWPCGTAPDSARPTTGSPSSWPTCAPRSAGPPTTATSTPPPPSPPTRRSSACGSNSTSPIAWAEELIEPARAVDHPRLAYLYVMASQCYMAGRIEAAVGYTDAGQAAHRQRTRRGAVRRRRLARRCVPVHRSARTVGRVVPRPARARSRHSCVHQGMPGPRTDDRRVALRRRWPPRHGLIDAAEATDNPVCAVVRAARLRLRLPRRRSRRALDALRRGLEIAHDSGNRGNESHLASVLSRLEADYGDPLAALDYLTVAIRNYHDSGNTTTDARPAGCPRRLLRPARTLRTGSHHQPDSPPTPSPRRAVPEINTAIAHLREVLGDQTYESFARTGATMTTAAMVAYAYDQIDQARAQLHARQ